MSFIVTENWIYTDKLNLSQLIVKIRSMSQNHAIYVKDKGQGVSQQFNNMNYRQIKFGPGRFNSFRDIELSKKIKTYVVMAKWKVIPMSPFCDVNASWTKTMLK